MNSAPPSENQPRLQRTLGFWDTVSLVAGGVIGVGIFLVPNRVANLVASPDSMLMIWAVAGAISLFGALAIAEFGSRYPQAGGIYIFLREAYGRPLAFLYGWTLLLSIQTANLASLAVAFPVYLGYLVPLTSATGKAVSIATITALTVANCLGVRRGAWLQNSLTVIKVLTLTLMIFFLLTADPLPESSAAVSHQQWDWASFGLAAIAILYAYEGWHLVTFAAGEVERPEKNLPRGLIAGILVVITLYLLANVSYLHVLPVHLIQSRPDVAAVSMESTLGRSGGAIVAGMILFSILGAMNALILSGPRVYYAMAQDGVFFQALARVSAKYRVPVYAILFQAGLAVAMALIAEFAQLLAYAIFAAWIFYALTVAGLWRVRQRDLGSPGFRCPVYPLLGFLFVSFALYIAASQITRHPYQSLFGLGVILVGLPVYGIWSRLR